MINEQAISLRAMTSADSIFLLRLYASTRSEELAAVAWTEQQKEDFLRFQFNAQHAHYQQHFSNANFDIVEINNAPAGRLYVDESACEIHVIDVTLLPEQRGQGIGTQLLTQLLTRAESTGKTVSLHVESRNPALRLYQRLGFIRTGEHQPYIALAWHPSTAVIRHTAPLSVKCRG